MSFNALETGSQTGEPVELYEFRDGPTFYRYTSADADVVFNTTTYRAISISRSGIEATSETARTPLTITLDENASICDLFRFAPPSEVITVSVFRFHLCR